MEHVLEFEADRTIIPLHGGGIAKTTHMVDINEYFKDKKKVGTIIDTKTWLNGAMHALSVALFSDDVEQFVNYWKEPIRKSNQMFDRIENCRNTATKAMETLDTMIHMALPVRTERLSEARTDITEFLDRYKHSLIQDLETWIANIEEYVDSVLRIHSEIMISCDCRDRVIQELHGLTDAHFPTSGLNQEWLDVIHSTIDDEAAYCLECNQDSIVDAQQRAFDNVFGSNLQPSESPSINLAQWNSPQIDNVVKTAVHCIDVNVINLALNVLMKYEKHVGTSYSS